MFIATLSTEFIKLRRSKMLLLAMLASVIPPMIRFIQYAFGSNGDAASWERFLSTGQEIGVFCMLTAVILVSCFIFTMEYQYRTASYLFTSGASKTNIFIAKILAVLVITALLFVVSAFSQLLFGYLTIRTGLAWAFLLTFIKVTAWYVLAYFLLSALVAMVAVLLKKFVLSAVVNFGYFMLVFPFHLKSDPYINPFMSPTVVAAKLYDAKDYIFTGYYKDIPVSIPGIAVFLLSLAIVSLAVGMVCYKRMDAIK